MIPSISVRHTLDSLSARLALLPQERMAAAVRALNRTVTTVRAQASRDLSKEYPGLKIGVIKKRLRFARATRSQPSASITFSNHRFSLYHNWKVRQTRTGVRVGRLPWALEDWEGKRIPATLLRHAFIQSSTNNRGQHNVYLRVGRERYPILGLVAPSLSSALVERGIGLALSRFARDRFAVAFEQEAKFRLSKRA